MPCARPRERESVASFYLAVCLEPHLVLLGPSSRHAWTSRANARTAAGQSRVGVRLARRAIVRRIEIVQCAACRVRRGAVRRAEECAMPVIAQMSSCSANVAHFLTKKSG